MLAVMVTITVPVPDSPVVGLVFSFLALFVVIRVVIRVWDLVGL